MNEATLLVVGLYVHDDLLAHAINTFAGFELFNQFTDPGCKMLWECMSDTYKTTGKKPTLVMIHQMAADSLATVDALAREKAQKQARVALGLMTHNEHPLAREHTMRLLEDAAHTAALDKLLSSAKVSGGTTGKLIEFVDGVSNMLNSVAPKQGVRKRPLAKDQRKKLLRSIERRPWHIPFMDKSHLQWNSKEIHGLLGPSGGGKTVIMVMMAAALIKEGYNVLVALYEQALEEDVEQRIISNVCRVPMTALRGKEEGDIDPKHQEIIDRVCDEFVDKLVVFDMIGEEAGDGGMQELKAMTEEEERETGFKPDIVIMDWLGAMVTRYKHLGATDAAYRRQCERFMFDIVEWKEDTGGTYVVIHQTNTEAQERNCTFKPNKNMAHEFKSFGNFTDTTSVLGVMDRGNKVCHYIPDKSRRSHAVDRLIQLDGEWMRFEDVTGEFDAVQGAFMPASAIPEQQEEADRLEQGGWNA